MAEPSSSSSTHRATAALAALAVTPLLLGGFAPFTWAVAGFAAAMAAAALPARATVSQAQRRLLTLALVALAIPLIQLLPLPPAVGAALAPGAAALDRSLGGTTGWTPLSRDPSATREAALAILISALLVATATVAAGRREGRRTLLVAVVAAAAAVAAVGVLEAFLSRPLLRSGLPDHARPFGPFANRNHAAALLLLALPCAAGLARDFGREGRRIVSSALDAAAGLLLLALLVNGSRGGLLAALLLVGAVVLRARGPIGWRLAAGGALALLIALPGAAWARRHETTTVGERVALASDALRMGLDAPFTGIGLGAFGAAYPPCQTVALDLRFRHVESEPIELFVEGGVPLVVGALAAAATIAAACVRVVRRRRASWADAGAALGVVAVLAHACCDFPLRVPGVVLPLLLVMSCVLAADAANAASAVNPEPAP